MCCCRLTARRASFFLFALSATFTPALLHQQGLLLHLFKVTIDDMETRLASTSRSVLRAASIPQWTSAKFDRSAALLHSSSRRRAGKQPEVSSNAGLSWDECERYLDDSRRIIADDSVCVTQISSFVDPDGWRAW